jgi:hypothetical protein
VAAPSKTVLTYRYESLRAVSAGVIEAASGTFLLLIAVRWFHAGAFGKGCVAAGSGLGYLLTPVVVGAVSRSGMPAAQAASRLAAAGAAALALAAAVPVLPVYVLASLLSLASAGAIWPLLTQIYQDNYPADSRGRFFSRTVMIRIVTAAAFSAAAGRLLAADIGYFRSLLLVFSAAMAFAAWCLSRVPSRPLAGDAGRNPLRVFLTVRDDRVFRATLMAWMLMGFANLMMLPLRVEFLANPKYGLALRADTIALFTAVVPNVARLIVSPIWGWLFDRANFFVLRMTLNLGFAIGILTFFTSNSTLGLVTAAVIFGISTGGSDLAWSLWVTKIAPPNRVADYMSVHTFFTGVRGLIAPIVGFALVAMWPMSVLGFISAGFIVGATLMLLPEARVRRPLRSRPPTLPALPADEGEA